MVKNNLNKEILKVIKERLANGENKADIFSYLQVQFSDNKHSAMLLAMTPYPDQCRKCRTLNYVLIGVLVVITIVKVFFTALFILSELPKAIPILVFVPLINICIIYLVAKFHTVVYFVIVGLGIYNLSEILNVLFAESIVVNVPMTLMSSLLVIVAIILSVVQFRRLLPDTTLLMQPKKNEAGEYIF